MKPYDVFICYKKSSGKDFADHLKAGLEELGLHSFLDSKDIPQIIDGREEWARVRDRALEESKVFILIITPGFQLSPEVIKELSLARRTGNKEFIYFRHRNLGRKIILDLGAEKLDLGKQEQVSFETKEELLRHAHNVLFKGQHPNLSVAHGGAQLAPSALDSAPKLDVSGETLLKDAISLRCAMCSKPIKGEPHIEFLAGKSLSFDSRECAATYRRLKGLYGERFE